MTASRSSTASRQEVGKQGLEDAEALGSDRPGGSLARDLVLALARGRGRSRGRPVMRVARSAGSLDDEPAKGRRLQRDRTAFLAEDPAREQRERGVLGDEHVLLDAVAPAVVDPPEPPGGVGRDLDSRLARDLAELPVGPAPVLLDVEVLGHPEVALAPRRVADVRADARDAEVLDDLVVLILADHVPGAVLGQEREGIELAVAELVPGDRPVAELHCALLRDGPLELAEAALELGRVVGIAYFDPHGVRGRRVVERPTTGQGRGSGARAAAARRTRSGLRGGRGRSGARRARRPRARAAGGSTAPSGACTAPRRCIRLAGSRAGRRARRARRGRSRSGARTPRRSSPGSPRRST